MLPRTNTDRVGGEPKPRCEMDLIGGIHDNLSLHVLMPFSRLHRSSRPATRPTQQAFDEGLRFRREAAKWDLDRRTDWILNRVRQSVRRAYEETVYYRELFAENGFDPRADFSFDDFARLPVLTREDVHAAGLQLLSSAVPKDQLRKDSTGGSTGVPTEIWLGPNERGWRDSGMERFFEMLGVPEGSRTALFWGHHLDPKKTDTFRERYQAFVSNTRWFDSLRLSPETLDEYHRELERFRPACIIAYASALGQLAEHILVRNYKPNYPTRCLITGAEKLWSRHRKLIIEAFGRPVHERYGSRDAACIGVQLDPEHSLEYTVDWANTLIEPQSTEPESPILVTKLQADAMPMLRYQIGDVARFPSGSRPGHPTFVLPDVMGRVLDRILLPNGNWIAGQEVPHLLKDFPVREFLFLQRQDHSVQLQIVPQNEFGDDSLRRIRETLAANLPGLQIEIELKESVVRTKSNKWRPVISEVKTDSRAFV
jgi:phenylacetate-coenzyme A ligase PaaK-like adenylate-forming protein